MRKVVGSSAFCFALFVFGLSCGWTAQTPPVSIPATKAPHVFNALQGTLRTNQYPVKSGDPVQFLYTVTNTGKTARTLSFGSDQRFDLVITQNGQAVWQMSREQRYFMYGVRLVKVVLAAGQKKTFSVTWKPSSSPVKPGTAWKVTAYLTPMKTRPNGSLASPSAPPLPTDHPALAELSSVSITPSP